MGVTPFVVRDFSPRQHTLSMREDISHGATWAIILLLQILSYCHQMVIIEMSHLPPCTRLSNDNHRDLSGEEVGPACT